jgi:hypothetical protein
MKLTLGKQLGSGFGVSLVLMVLSAVLTYSKASSIKETQTLITEVRVPTIGDLKDLQRELNQTQNKGRQAILAGGDQGRREAATKVFGTSWDEVGKIVARLDELSPRWTIQTNRDRLAEVKQDLPSLRETQEAIIKQAASAMPSPRPETTMLTKPLWSARQLKSRSATSPISFASTIELNTEEMNAQDRSMNLTMAIIIDREAAQS